MMRNDSMESLSHLEIAKEENLTHNGTGLTNNPFDFEQWLDLREKILVIMAAFVLVISIFGLMGNGAVIWFLGFRMKRNPFATFILNLAIADLGVLICLVSFVTLPTLLLFSCSLCWPILHFGVVFLFYMYITGQFLLTAISIDRCVSVLFPIWHRCHRPQHLSTIVCALIWILTFVLVGIAIYVIFNPFGRNVFSYVFLIPPLLCLPLTTVSSLILLIKVFLRPQQRKQRRTLRAILLALLFFLFFAFTLTFLTIINNFQFIYSVLINVGYLSSCLNSSVNPLIYFLVGRKKQSQSRESMKVVLQRLFKEEEHGREEVELRVSPQI